MAAKEEKGHALPEPPSDGLSYTFEDRRYTVRGLKSYGLDKLKVTVRLDLGDLFHLDTLDLYSAQGAGALLPGGREAAEGGPRQGEPGSPPPGREAGSPQGEAQGEEGQGRRRTR